MGYTLPQITQILAKADRTMYKTGMIAYQNMFSELDEALDYHRDIIYIYKKAVEWGDDYFVGTEKLDKIVERLAGMIAVWDYGMLTPIYNDVAQDESSVLPPCYLLVDLCDVNITNVQDGQYLTYDNETKKWINTGPGAAIRYSESITATAGQTVFVTTNPFVNGLFDLYLNGVRLNTASYSTFGSYSITLVDACYAGDILDITIYDNNASISSILSLTTTGSTGAATLIGTVLNVPNYGLESISSAAVTGTSTKTLTLTKLGGGTVVTSWTDSSDNIYNSNGTLTGNRTLTSGGYSLTFTGTNNASSGSTKGMSLTHTLVANANNDILIGLEVNPTFTSGAYTGLSNLAARFNGNVLMGSVPNTAGYSYVPLTLCNSLVGGLKTQLALVNSGAGTGSGSAIDFYTYTDQGNGLPGVRIASIDDNNFSGNFQILSKVQGTPGNGALTTKFQIFGGTGNILIQSGGVQSDNGYKLDVNGTTRIQSTTTLSSLAGTGSRMVVASSTGVLSTQAITTGTVTSVNMSVPTGFAISGNPVTSTGTLALAFASGYSLPTNVKQSNWDDAYTWVAAFPSQTGNGGKYLTTDGSTLSWGDSIPGFEANFLLMGA